VLRPLRIRPFGANQPISAEAKTRPDCDDLPSSGSHPLVTGSSDADLIADVIAGNTDSFSLLVRRHQDTCVRFAVRMLGSRVDADDVLQSAFMRAFRNLRSCRDRERFGGWLYQIVVNECRTFATRRHRREQRFLSATGEIERAIAPGSDDSAERDVGGHIERALGMLPADQREAFLLKHVEELTYEEISEMTGASISALKMRVKRAADSLRDLLEGVYHG
jgi:RNA polymerase sigma-70 factor (ECF subfamily)